MSKKKKSSKSKGKRHVEIRYVAAPQNETGILAGIKKLLPEDTSQQFLVGLMIGTGAAYILSDEALRRQIIRYALQTYADVAGGLQGLKEQVADVQAEILAEHATGS